MPAGKSFTHLHTHTEYSMLDGAARVDHLVDAALADGQPALGITDHGNMYGVLEFYKACKAKGIKPIIGTEAYMAGESRTERPQRRGQLDDGGGNTDGGEKLYYHLTVLAENLTGYRNLIKLSSEAYLSGYYYKPRVDWELLEQFSEGLIVTTGCLGGVVLQALLRDDVEEATALAARLQDIFGRDSLFVEIQDHHLAAQKRTNPQLIEIARKINAPLLATNDSHYTHREDAKTHDALLCVQTGALISEQNRFRFEGEEHYLKSAAEMRELFSGVEEACDNTLWIAERANLEIPFGVDALPEFPVPEHIKGKTYEERAGAYLRELTYAGARERYGNDLPVEVVERLDYELGVVSQMGFSAYFLVVWDLIVFARREGIRVGPGRGSAAGSCVAYCLRIVDIDPIRYDLLFERFLNPGRRQMPDIDMDFDERYRGDMIRYASERYGSDHVAQIVTFSTIKARAAVRDAARVLGHPWSEGDKIAKAMPPLVMGRDTPLHACFELTPGHEDGFKAAGELRNLVEADATAKEIIEVARGLEGLRRQDGIHAAAVVITKETLTEYLPIQRKPDPKLSPEETPTVTQYEGHGVEDLGLLKMDFLGLRNLSVIERTLDLVEMRTGERLDIDGVDLNDNATLELLQRGESVGVFQLESPPMRELMKALRPTSFDDVAALVALYRPGPMANNMHYDYADHKNGRKDITYLHPDLEPILSGTQGLMIYQESVMRVAQRFAGYSLEEADNLRKACGKKIREVMEVEREKFESGCEANGYGRALGKQLFDVIEPFADYAFNKSHSYGYGYVAYQTAWLKAHFPVEYLCALLTSVRSDKDKTAVYLGECRAMGLSVAVPDVNESLADFAPRVVEGEPDSIRFGLASVRNVGESIVERIVAERTANGPFTDVVDFARRVDEVVLNKRTMESLIKAGAFDSLGHPRQGLMLCYEQLIERTIERRREHALGVQDLFASLADSPEEAQWSGTEVEVPELEFEKSDLLAFEKEMLGMYVSDHPLTEVEGALRRHIDVSLAEVNLMAGEGGDGKPLTKRIGGILSSVQQRTTKSGELMAIVVLEDLDSSVEAMVFPKTFAEYGQLLTPDAIVVLRCRIDAGERLRLIVHEVSQPVLTDATQGPMRINLPKGQVSNTVMQRLKEIIANHPGTSPVFIHTGEQVIRLPDEHNIDVVRAAGELRVLLGPDALIA